jgi:hypothetical protein
MEVATGATKEESAQSTQHGISKIAMQPRHGSILNTAGEPIPHGQVCPRAQLIEECGDVSEVIARIRVSHDNKFASRRLHSAHQRTAISVASNFDHAGSQSFGDLIAAVLTAVIGDDDLAFHPMRSKCFPDFGDTSGQRLRFVQAGHHHRHFGYSPCYRPLQASGFQLFKDRGAHVMLRDSVAAPRAIPDQ